MSETTKTTTIIPNNTLQQIIFLKNVIAFEGLDGCGKSTLAKSVVKLLDNRGELQIAPSPTSRFHDEIRHLLSTPDDDDNKTKDKKKKKKELYLDALFLADSVHYVSVITQRQEELMKQEKIAVFDRYTMSHVAYRSETLEQMVLLLKEMFILPQPFIYFYLDTPVDTCINRIKSRVQKSVEVFEKKDTLEKVQKSYEQIFSLLENKITLVRLDGTKSVELLTEEVITKMVLLFSQQKKETQ